MMLAGTATLFYKRKQTMPFKVAYFLAWPTLGAAVILVGMPSRQKMVKELEGNGTLEPGQLEEHRQRGVLQMAAIKQAAEAGKQTAGNSTSLDPGRTS
ncbi:hypothetical protein WJX72_007654 [[Myrmecia] bisecta]|uniref:Uncharacterized protein n=1 Tax=[Myrmecia] bisecta TaxID=41462 RepID=A0AAW1QFM3_9CHLO